MSEDDTVPVCPDCQRPATVHDMYDPPMCPVVRVPLPTREELAAFWAGAPTRPPASPK